jgi:hypothetical protein
MPMVDETTAGIGSLITRRPLDNTSFNIIGILSHHRDNVAHLEERGYAFFFASSSCASRSESRILPSRPTSSTLTLISSPS